MGADIYESFVAIVIGCLALGATMAAASVEGITNFKLEAESDLNYFRLLLMMWPIFQGDLGVVAGTLAIKMFDIIKILTQL
jgi:Na+/H+-translocating membrane pyrophosphatase